ncbi:hypothetical protein ACA910_003178 [Epithemia clementina (nom. ined.)]
MVVSDYSDSSSKHSRSILAKALTQRRTGFSPDVLVADQVRDEDLLESSSSASGLQQSAAAKNVVRNSLISGSLSGMASTMILYPMDFLRTNMQAAGIPNATSAGGGSSAASPGPLQVLRQTLQTGGIRALYTGMALPLIAQAVYKGTVFTVNNLLEQTILDYKQTQRNESQATLTTTDRLLCGFIAGAVNGATFVTPVEYVRNQLIAEQARRSATSAGAPLGTGIQTSLGVIRQALYVNGVHTLWRGVGITMLRDGMGVASFFSTLAFTQHVLMNAYYPDGGPENITNVQPPLVIRVVSGGMGGLAYWITSLPLDTVKTWVQSSDPSVRVSPIKIIQQLYSEGGVVAVVRRLGRGWQVAYGRGIPSSAITIGVYSYTYQWLQQYDPS